MFIMRWLCLGDASFRPMGLSVHIPHGRRRFRRLAQPLQQLREPRFNLRRILAGLGTGVGHDQHRFDPGVRWRWFRCWVIDLSLGRCADQQGG